MTIPNKAGYDAKQIHYERRYMQQMAAQPQTQQPLMGITSHQGSQPIYAGQTAGQQAGYPAVMFQQQQQQHLMSQQLMGGYPPVVPPVTMLHPQAMMHQQPSTSSGIVMTQGGMIMTSPQAGGMINSPMMSSPTQPASSKKGGSAKKRKSQGAEKESKKKKSKKKGEKTEENGDDQSPSTTPSAAQAPAIPFGNSGVIKSPKVIKEEITQINDMFDKSFLALIERFKNVSIRQKNVIHPPQPSLCTYKEEEKYRPKDEEVITSFTQATTQPEGEEEQAPTVPQQAIFNPQQQAKLLQNYPVFAVGRQNQATMGDAQLHEEEKNRKRLFYKDGNLDYITTDDLIDEFIIDAENFFKREGIILGIADNNNAITNHLKARLQGFVENNRAMFETFLASAGDFNSLCLFVSQQEEFQQVMSHLRVLVEAAGKNYEERVKEEVSNGQSIILSSGSTSDMTDEAIDQLSSINDMSGSQADYSKNVSLIEMTPKDILLVFLGKDAQNEKQEDVNNFLERFRELQKQYRVECSYIEEGCKTWQSNFEKVLNNQSAYRVVSFEERHRCKKSLESRFSLMKQLLKDKYLTKVLSLQENTLLRSKRRGNLPRHSTNVLKSWLFSHFLHPYPSESEKKDLCTETGLTLTQVNNWFINQRVRTWRPMLESMLDEKDKTSNGNSGAIPAQTRPVQQSPQETKKRGKKNAAQPQQAPPPQQMMAEVGSPLMQQQMLADMSGATQYQHYGGYSQYMVDPQFAFFGEGHDGQMGSPQQ